MPNSTQSSLVSLARATPLGLARLADGSRFAYPQHLRLLNNALMDTAALPNQRTAFFLPPRHAKSASGSRAFPAWFMGRFADKRILLSSYEAEFAAGWGYKARELIREYGPEVFGVDVSRDRSAANSWTTTNGSEMVTTGVGGGLTGRGADVLVIDDPVKNAEQAHSETYRNKAWDWYTSTAYTRLEPGGSIILIMTRWHEDDLGGRILANAAEQGERWNVINLPALAEEDDMLGRAPGEALWPARFPREILEGIRGTLGEYWFNALYQQRPAPIGGGFLKREHFRYFDLVPVDDEWVVVLHTPEGDRVYPMSRCLCFQTIDLAATAKETSDYVVIGTFLVTPESDLLVMDIDRRHAEGPEQKAVLLSVYHKHQPAYVGVETVAYQATFMQEMARQGLPVIPLQGQDKNKVDRALTLAVRYELGKVYHRRQQPWLDDYERELTSFPVGKNDDQVDVTAYAAIEVANNNRRGLEVADKPAGW